MPKKDKVIVSTVPQEVRDSGDGIKILFDSPMSSNRPTNCYKEKIISPDSGDTVEVLWYTTEQGDEIGRIGIKKKNDMDPDDKTLLGYNYTILASRENIEKLKKESFGRTMFIIKDGQSRYTIPRDSF